MTLFSASPQILLVFSLLALLAGPLFFYFAKFNESILKGCDGFVLTVICGLVSLHILPHTIEEIGWVAIVIVGVSLLLPTLIERMKMRVAKTAHTLTLILAVLGISLHAFTDGMALVNPATEPNLLNAAMNHGNMLPMAIILHRIPDGLTIWWLLRPLYGNGMAVRTIILMAIATILGFFVGQMVFAHLSHEGIGVFEALVGGSLLHVIFHHAHPMQKQKETPGWQLSSGLGSFLGMVLIAYIIRNTIDTEMTVHLKEFFTTLKMLALESAPALVIAYLLAGAVQTFMPHAAAAWLKKGNAAQQALKGVTFGLPLSICSCGVVPVYRSLILQGTPVAAAIAFFVATPELSLDAFLLSIPLLGASFTGLRIIAAFIMAFVMGIVIHKVSTHFKKASPLQTPDIVPSQTHLTFLQKCKHAIKQGYVESIDDTGPWILFGLIIAAFLEPFLKSSLHTQSLPSFLEVPLFALIGMPLYICASGATPLVAILLHNGISPGAGLAFLLTGPATNVTTFGVLNQYHGRRVAIAFAAGMAFLSITMGWVVNLIYNSASLPPLFTHVHPTLAIIQKFSLIFLLVLLLFSLLRRGPRAIINTIISFDADDKDSHDDHHDHAGHNHSAPAAPSCCH